MLNMLRTLFAALRSWLKSTLGWPVEPNQKGNKINKAGDASRDRPREGTRENGARNPPASEPSSSIGAVDEEAELISNSITRATPEPIEQDVELKPVNELAAKPAESSDPIGPDDLKSREVWPDNPRDRLEILEVPSHEPFLSVETLHEDAVKIKERPSPGESSGGLGHTKEGALAPEEPEETAPIVLPGPQKQGTRKHAPRYRAPAGVRSPPSRRRKPNIDKDGAVRSRAVAIEVRVLFKRGGHCSVTLLPKRSPDLPEELVVEGGGGNVELIALGDEWYQDFVPDSLGELLQKGLVLGDSSNGQEWILAGREVFVFVSGDTHRGFVSCPRLMLGRDHVVLCAEHRLRDVEEALLEAGCSGWARLAEDDGVPVGWTLLRGISPQRTVPLRDGEDILNILRPLPEIEIALERGIRLAYNTWLHGYPPVIRVWGDSEHTSRVLIDGQEANRSGQDTYTAPGWADLGDHQVWCGNTSKSYSIATSEGNWKFWPAYSFCPGSPDDNDATVQEFSFCGPLVRSTDFAEVPETDPRSLQFFQVPPSNPILIGAKPGDVFQAHPRRDLRGAPCLALPKFDPVWALPVQPLHCDKKTSRVLLIGNATEIQEPEGGQYSISQSSDVDRWFRLILDASRKGLSVEPADRDIKHLWDIYKDAARRLRKRFR